MKEKKRLTPEEELRIDRRIQISVIIIAVIMLLYLFWALRSGKNPGRPFSICGLLLAGRRYIRHVLETRLCRKD